MTAYIPITLSTFKYGLRIPAVSRFFFRPTDIAWSPTKPWHLTTAAEDNVIQIWSPNSTITKGPNGIVIPVDELE